MPVNQFHQAFRFSEKTYIVGFYNSDAMTHSRILFFLFIWALTAVFSTNLVAQRTCGYEEEVARLMVEDPGFEQRTAEIRRHMETAIQQGASQGQRTVYRIPVVVHVIYNTPAQDLPDAQILSQIDVLNEDFRRFNLDTVNTPQVFKNLAADTEIEFCLATLDPSGMPTTGITRTETTTTTFSGNDMKADATGGKDPWPRTEYLNMWVCKLGGGLLGFSSPMGAPAAEDGVVMGHEYFGRVGNLDPSFDLGRTATHEVGHWLGLDHPWGGGGCSSDDNINDTPMQDAPNFGCQTFPSISCSNGPNGDMFMNYMDYSDDACFSLFTQDQKTVMRALFAPGGVRASLLNSPACGPFFFDDAGVLAVNGPSGTLCGGDISPSVTLVNYGNTPLTAVNITYLLDGNTVGTYLWTGNLDSAETELINLPPFVAAPGAHVLSVMTADPNGSSDFNVANDMALGNFIALNAAGLPLPLIEGFEAAAVAPADWEIVNPDNSVTWTVTADVGKNSKSSIFMDNYNYPGIGQQDLLELPGFDISDINSGRLAFDVAYALYTPDGGFADTLEVYFSGDCGQTFQRVYQKSGAQLQTAPATTAPFVPTNSQWRREFIPFDNYVGTTYLLVRFRHVTNYENNLYLDNINLLPTYPTGIESELADLGLVIFPNPATDQVQVVFESTAAREVVLILQDLAGKVIRTNRLTARPGSNQAEITVAGLSVGMYLLKMTDGERQVVRKLQVE